MLKGYIFKGLPTSRIEPPKIKTPKRVFVPLSSFVRFTTDLDVRRGLTERGLLLGGSFGGEIFDSVGGGGGG